MPALFRIQKEVIFPPEQQEFLQHCRTFCFENARQVSRIISEALRYGLKVLADSWICIIAHDSTKVMLHYLTLNKKSTDFHQREVNDTISLVQSNLDALLQMRSIVATAEHCVSIQSERSLEHLLTFFQQSLSIVKMMAAAGIQPEVGLQAPANDLSRETEDAYV